MTNHPIRVLLVEDDEDDYVIIQSLFSEIGGDKFDLEWVATYDAALKRITQSQHDLYLVDYGLGAWSGLELLRESVLNGCKAPLILLTGQGDSKVDVAAMRAGAADCLIKGQIDAPILERSMHYAIEQVRTLEELRQALREKNQQSLAIANLATGVVITDPNLPDNPITFVNPGFTTMTGYSAAELLGQNCRMLQGPETDRVTVKQMREAIVAQQPLTCTMLNYRKDGTPFWNELRISPVFDSDGKLIHFIGLQTDVTARKQAEAALRESEERYALAVQGANDGIWDWNLRTNKVYFSPRWKSMLGYEEHEVGDGLEEWLDRVHPDDLDWIKIKISAHLDGLTPHFEHEHRMRRQNGTYHWMLSRGLAVRDAEGKATRMAGSQADITKHKQAEEQLLHDAFHDTLTGLPNRALLINRLHHVVQLAKQNENYLFGVLFLDLDRFKVINDSLGHMIGDRLLVAIAQRLSNSLRPGDTIARLGGDEFVILMENLKDVSNVALIADRIQRELALPFNLDGYEVFTTASIGIALSATGYDWSEDLLRDADIAMYRAKAHGRARYEIFNRSMHTRAVALLQLETDLRRAIASYSLDCPVEDHQEIQLHYQPIVSLTTLRITGFEALVRWHHPSRGMISPIDFIPLAEETGLITPIGWWVLRQACCQMKAWQIQFPAALPLTISVNLSGKQLAPQLVEQISHILQEAHLDARYLKLEITESMLMENAELATTMLSQLKALGIQLAIDDFGTGYSSLSYLHRFPIDTLKIDRSFISKIDTDAEQLTIVRTIIMLAWNLGMDVVAEGIETSKQLAQLRALKCEYGQGYLFSRPVDGETAGKLIAAESQWSQLKPLPAS